MKGCGGLTVDRGFGALSRRSGHGEWEGENESVQIKDGQETKDNGSCDDSRAN